MRKTHNCNWQHLWRKSSADIGGHTCHDVRHQYFREQFLLTGCAVDVVDEFQQSISLQILASFVRVCILEVEHDGAEQELLLEKLLGVE